MTDSDDRRFRSPQFLGTVTNLEEFKKEKARKKAHEDSRDTRPDAEIIDFPSSTPADREEDVRSKMTEEEKAKDPPMHEHDCD